MNIDEHTEIAEHFREMRELLRPIMSHTCQLPKHSRAYEGVGRLSYALSNARLLLDAQMAADCPNTPHPSPYYARGVHDAR